MGRVPVNRQSGLQQKSPSAQLPLTEASPSSTSPHISFESSPATRSSTTPCSDQSNKKNRAVLCPLSLGNVYDPIKNKFNLEEEEWQMEIKSNKYVQTLRTAPLLFPDLCIQLFEEVVNVFSLTNVFKSSMDS
ncbi:unnamed protein product [Lactuca saligna]|uniref:Uncharacterized protein n=1 Tax=Lactuca saligna TaxID=75948 RepID=A0AA36EMJ4_LACSI|nr:unnamed protein product [Lactuca saligna]